MRIACFIPIKSNSERVNGKNFRVLNGKKLYQHIIEHAIEANVFDDIYIDTNSEEVKQYAIQKECFPIERKEYLATNSANGNDLLNFHCESFPNYDYYFQLFATAPFLQPKTIAFCVEKLINSNAYDSIFTALKHNGFFWMNKNPINYRPAVLPRSQDLEYVIEETTGLYGIKKDSLNKYKCRIGEKPYIHFVDKFEAVDINTESDLIFADYIGKYYWKY